ncbi:MAG: hypothetical protein GXN99_00225 [Candidatus Nanohaloarchaeota archaeon]|nr:hypothetical protein [Candidatus Nanohaloarchaeota archaeon]
MIKAKSLKQLYTFVGISLLIFSVLVFFEDSLKLVSSTIKALALYVLGTAIVLYSNYEGYKNIKRGKS